MPTRTTTAVLALLAAAGLTLAGCTSSGSHDSQPAPTTPAATATTAAPTPDKAALIKACVAAIAAGKDDAAGGAPECNSLPTADYYEAIHEANEAAIGKFNDDTDKAASATP